MTCTWTDRDFYTEFVNTQLRGDGGILGNMYRPGDGQVKFKGGDVYVSIVDIENMTTSAPSCSALGSSTGNCNRFKELTAVERQVFACFTPGEWGDLDMNPGNMMAFVKAQASVLSGYLVDLIIADMIANGTAVSVGATPDKDDLINGVNEALGEIWARNLEGKITILFNTTDFPIFMNGAAGQFVPVQKGMLGPDISTDKAFRGWFNGAEVWLTTATLETADATPVPVSAIIFHEMGYAFASQGGDVDGDSLGAILGLVPAESNPKGTVVDEYIGGWFAYGLLDDEMVYYLTES